MALKHTNILTTSLAALILFTAPGCKQTSDKATAELERAKKLIAQGNYTEAFMQLNQALAEAPRDPNVHLNLGWLYLYTEDPTHAEAEWKKAQELAPDMAEVFHLKGSLLAYQGQQLQEKEPEEARKLYKESLKSLKESLQRDDKNYQTYFDTAATFTALNRNEQALETLDKGFEYIPKKDLETQVNFQIASCSANAQLQRYDEAIADCRQAEEFTTSPASKQRIEDMIENMKLLNPSLKTMPPDATNIPEQNTEEQAIINESATD